MRDWLDSIPKVTIQPSAKESESSLRGGQRSSLSGPRTGWDEEQRESLLSPLELMESSSVALQAAEELLPKKAQAKCLVKLGRLEDLGHELRRPEADYLRDDIYELRVRLQGVNYRMLYFFRGRIVGVVSHGIAKQKKVPAKEIDLAIARKRLFEADPKAHSE